MSIESMLAAAAAKIIFLASILRNVIGFTWLNRHAADRICCLDLPLVVVQDFIRLAAVGRWLPYQANFREDAQCNFLGRQPAEAKARRRSDPSEVFAWNAFRCQR